MKKRIDISITDNDWAFILRMAKELEQTPMEYLRDLVYSKLWEEREINDVNGNDNTYL